MSPDLHQKLKYALRHLDRRVLGELLHDACESLDWYRHREGAYRDHAFQTVKRIIRRIGTR